MKKIAFSIALFMIDAAYAIAASPIEIFPQSAYDSSTIYVNLTLFWGVVLGLIVTVKLKLREIERIQQMDTKEDEDKTPLLD